MGLALSNRCVTDATRRGWLLRSVTALDGIIAQGPPDEVLEHPAVIECYLGTDDAAINRSGAVANA